VNKRQRKKRARQQGKLTVVIGCDMKLRAEEYIRLRAAVQQQIDSGNVVLLPSYMHVEAIVKDTAERQIEIKTKESEGTA
jgi:hypothetical protein